MAEIAFPEDLKYKNFPGEAAGGPISFNPLSYRPGPALPYYSLPYRSSQDFNVGTFLSLYISLLNYVFL